MIDIALLMILVFGFFIGYRRGLVLQLIYLAGFLISFLVAYYYFADLAPKLKLWIPYPNLPEDTTITFFIESMQLETAYYRAIAFAILFFGTKIVMQIIGSMLDFLADLPLLNLINGWLGGLLGLIEVYFLIFFILYVGALIPIDFIQTIIQDSHIAKGIIENTPIISMKIKELWFANKL